MTAAQDHYKLDRQIKRLRDSGDGPVTEKLKSDVDELQKQVRAGAPCLRLCGRTRAYPFPGFP